MSGRRSFSRSDGSAIRTAETVPIQLKNGDIIHAERVPEEIDDSITVVVHPQLGRLEMSSDSIKEEKEPSAWS